MASLILFPFCDNHKNISHLGEVQLQVTGSHEAQPFFKEGLLLLHSFEYKDAAEQFRKAQEADPEFVMAYWGEAMTKNHPLWNAQYFDEGQEILNRLGSEKEERAKKAQTEIENDFLHGIEILFSEGEKYDRDQSYAEHMEKMYKKYPGNHEVAAFYALSLLGASAEGRDSLLYGRGAKVAQEVINKNPQHPGALHYLIHSYDDPDHAHLAIHAADRYSKVAPDAAHALHMPSHIYIALGMWDEVISSNIAAWEASLKRMKRKNLDNDARNYHALHWLEYGYLQRAEFSEARKLLLDMHSYTSELPSSRARGYFLVMKAAFMVGANDWNQELLEKEMNIEDLNISYKGVHHFISGMYGFTKNKPEKLTNAISEIENIRKEAEQNFTLSGAKMCSGISYEQQLPTQQDINHVYVMEMELKALLAETKNNLSEAEEWHQKATKLEDETSFMFGPPSIVKPSHELYGEWLLRQNRYEEALDQFNRALELAPGRRISVEGKETAQKV